jgi:hypothetical protein
MIRTAFLAVGAGCLFLLSCATGVSDDPGSAETFEEFEERTYQEPWEGGHYIVNGDTPIVDIKALEEFWKEMSTGQLIVHTVGGQDAKWNNTQKLNLTYCVNNNFGSRKSTVVAALQQATDAGWETMGNVNFIYVPAQDANCTSTNNNVVFNVRQVSGQPYLARAFFPNNSRSSREVLVDTSAFGNVGWPLENILGHELGHALGFRHEHTRPEAGTCFEDNNWRPLTPYDSASIMHYPQCNGTSDDLDWTARDAEGIAALYGAPGGGGGDPPPPPPPPPSDEQTETRSGSLAKYQTRTYGPYPVAVGSIFEVVMTGTGDPDLYVRWNSAPTLSSWHCRPYLWGANETCSLSVPSGATSAYVMVRGYTAATYSATITWTEP